MLLWSVPSCNIFGVLAVILGWVANSGVKKRFAYTAAAFYFLAAVLSGALALVLKLFLSGTALFDTAGIIAAAAIPVYIFCGALSLIGGRKIPGEEDTGGLFDD